MSNYRRYKGRCFFFTLVTYKRRNLFDDEFARECLHEAIVYVTAKRPVKIIAMCLMPNHIHCIWGLPEEDKDYSSRWQNIKRHFTLNYLAGGGKELSQSDSRKNRREKGVWQRRFWEHKIRDEDDLINHKLYIYRNPVKHGLVEKCEDWPWSSYQKDKKISQFDNVDWKAVDNLVLPGNIEYHVEE